MLTLLQADAANSTGDLYFKPMKAAVVLFSHYPSDPRPRRAAEALERAGMQVDVICLRSNEEEPSCEVYNGVQVRRVRLKRRRGGKLSYILQYGWFLLIAFLLLSARSLSRRYRLIHVHNMPDFLVFSALLPRLLGAKVILDLHDPMPELMMTIFGLARGSRGVRVLEVIEKLSIGFSHLVLTVNQGCAKIFGTRSCKPEKIRVIMNAPDETIFKFREVEDSIGQPRDPARPFVLMYHGSLVERHGLDLAVEAVAGLRQAIPNLRLQVYGATTPYLQEVMAEVARLGLQDVITHLGPRKLEQIVQAIHECDLGIIPNRRSIFTELNTPTRIFEYLSQGKPVLAPAAPGIEDYFSPDELLYFRLGEAQDLACQIRFAYEHPDEVLRVTRRGQSVYLNHKWAAERERFLACVKNLLKPRASGGVATLKVPAYRQTE